MNDRAFFIKKAINFRSWLNYYGIDSECYLVKTLILLIEKFIR